MSREKDGKAKSDKTAPLKTRKKKKKLKLQSGIQKIKRYRTERTKDTAWHQLIRVVNHGEG
jgi:hypothetical protein